MQDEDVGRGCVLDTDCPANLVCFSSNLTWNSFGFSFCDCTTWYGWVKLHSNDTFCLGFSGATYATLVWNALLLIGYFLVGGLLLRDLVVLLMAPPGRRINTMFVSMVIFMLTAFVGVIYEAYFLFAIVSPEGYVIPNDGEKWSVAGLAKNPIFAVQVSLVSLGCLQISLVWYEVAKRSVGPEITRQEIFLRRLVIVIEIFFATGVILDFVLDSGGAHAALICLPFFLLIIIVNCGALFRFEKALSLPPSGEAQVTKRPGRGQIILQNLKEVFSTSDTVNSTGGDTNPNSLVSFEKRKAKLVREMKRASFGLSVSILGSVILGLAVNILLSIGWTEFCPVGSALCLPTVLEDIMDGIFLVAVIITTRFMHLSTQASVQATKKNGVAAGGARNEQSGERPAGQSQETATRLKMTNLTETGNAMLLSEADWVGGGTFRANAEPTEFSRNLNAAISEGTEMSSNMVVT